MTGGEGTSPAGDSASRERGNRALGPSRVLRASRVRSEIRERASRFLGFAFRADDEASARERVAALGREFHDATHVCFAWRIGPSARAADAGEPAGTAGKPMLAAIDALGLDCAAVAVVRYFGGTKLGTAGLVRCYRAAAKGALEDAGSEEVFDTVEIEIDVPYDRVAQVKRAIEPPEIALIEETFSERARFRREPWAFVQLMARLSIALDRDPAHFLPAERFTPPARVERRSEMASSRPASAYSRTVDVEKIVGSSAERQTFTPASRRRWRGWRSRRRRRSSRDSRTGPRTASGPTRPGAP